jgi:hypothetical protein
MKRWLDKELPTIGNTRVDLLGETIGCEFVHLEFMSENQKLFDLRMAEYYVEIYQACGRRPRQTLVYVGRGKLRMRGHFKSSLWRRDGCRANAADDGSSCRSIGNQCDGGWPVADAKDSSWNASPTLGAVGDSSGGVGP